MPGAMIHLAVGRAFDADASGLFYVGNLAPDFTDERAIKSVIHLRSAPDREVALRELCGKLDLENAFELGWLLHLFADWRWDSSVVPAFHEGFTGGEDKWFLAYRAELGRLSRSMFHNEPWRREVWERIDAEDVQAALSDMRKVTPVLPVPLELGWYCNRVERRHAMDFDASPELFTAEMALEFAEETAGTFKRWL